MMTQMVTNPYETVYKDSSIITANELTKQYGSEYAVNQVSFYVPHGSIFGFVGPSGCGKTTTVRLMTGIYKPTSGEARVLGHNPVEFTRSDRERIGYMPQLFVLYPDLTVWENINFTASIYGVGLKRNRRLYELLEFVELKEDRKKLVKNISGGMQRRLSLASTLVHSPELLFLDEPTAGIDPVLRRKFWDYFNELRSSGSTLFVTTQYVSEAAYCDMVGVMNEGRLLMVATPEGLRKRAYGGEIVDLTTRERIDYQLAHGLRNLPFVQAPIDRVGDTEARILVDEASTAMPAIIEWCRHNNLTIESIQEYLPPFDDVFVKLIQGQTNNA